MTARKSLLHEAFDSVPIPQIEFTFTGLVTGAVLE